MWGLRDLTLLPNAGLLDWDNMAEFMAITLTNMYRSEANAPRLRWDHNSYCHRQRVEALPISPRLQPAFDQSINERHWLTRLSWSWFGRDGGLLEAVSSFDLSFNPFERYLRARPSRTPFMGSVVPGNGVCP